MCKWILSEVDDPAVVPYWPWPDAPATHAQQAAAISGQAGRTSGQPGRTQ
jgi:hypothetical protein